MEIVYSTAWTFIDEVTFEIRPLFRLMALKTMKLDQHLALLEEGPTLQKSSVVQYKFQSPE